LVDDVWRITDLIGHADKLFPLPAEKQRAVEALITPLWNQLAIGFSVLQPRSESNAFFLGDGCLRVSTRHASIQLATT
jgi:hypothetical protein